MPKTTSPHIVLTRPQATSESFAAEILAKRPNAEIIISPVLKISYRDNLQLPPAEALVFTSRHGVDGYARLNGIPRRAYCVGQGTAERARAKGHDVVAQELTSQALEPVLREVAPLRLLHVRGSHVAGDFASALSHLDEVIVYDQNSEPLSNAARQALEGESATVLPLFSPRSARHLREQIDPSAPLFLAFISDAVRDAFGKIATRNVIVADRPDRSAMLEATLELLDAACALEGDPQGD